MIYATAFLDSRNAVAFLSGRTQSRTPLKYAENRCDADGRMSRRRGKRSVRGDADGPDGPECVENGRSAGPV